MKNNESIIQADQSTIHFKPGIRLQFKKPIQKIPINSGEQKKHVMKKYLHLEKQAHFEKVVETKKEDETDSGF